MRPLTDQLPKALLPVRGVPVVDHQLKWLRAQGVQRLVACLGHHADLIRSHLASVEIARSFDTAISDEGEASLGTAGAVRLAIDRGLVDGRFLTLYGDTIPAFDLAAALCFWKASGAASLLCVYPASSGGDDARAVTHNGKVLRFSRHPSLTERALMTHGDYGMAGFDTAQFAHLAVGTRVGFGALHANLAARGDLAAYDVGRSPEEIGTIAAYERAQDPAAESRTFE